MRSSSQNSFVLKTIYCYHHFFELEQRILVLPEKIGRGDVFKFFPKFISLLTETVGKPSLESNKGRFLLNGIIV